MSALRSQNGEGERESPAISTRRRIEIKVEGRPVWENQDPFVELMQKIVNAVLQKHADSKLTKIWRESIAAVDSFCLAVSEESLNSVINDLELPPGELTLTQQERSFFIHEITSNPEEVRICLNVIGAAIQEKCFQVMRNRQRQGGGDLPSDPSPSSVVGLCHLSADSTASRSGWLVDSFTGSAAVAGAGAVSPRRPPAAAASAAAAAAHDPSAVEEKTKTHDDAVRGSTLR